MVRIDFSHLRILVVDDNAHMRRIVRTLLNGFGVRDIYEADNGATGLEAFNQFVPDIILTDWAMPGWYHVEAAALGGEPSDVQFQLTAPEREVVTKTIPVKPKRDGKKSDQDKQDRDKQDRTNRG